MSEYARHTVTFREGALRINFLTPGQFQIPLPSGKWAKVKIATGYPTQAQATIEIENLPADVAVKLRVPSCVRKPEVKQVRSGEKLLVAFRGELGHRIEQCHPGVMVTYGPLVLIPATWSGPLASPQGAGDAAAPAGYIPQSMPAGVPAIKLDSRPDANGFVHLPTCPPERPLPDWTYFDEGPGAPTVGRGVGRRSAFAIPFRRSAARAFYADVLQHVESLLVRDAGCVPRRPTVAWLA